MTPVDSPIQYEFRSPTALLRIDDAKANAVTHELLRALRGGLQRAEAEADSLVIEGRPGWFCAGFHRSLLAAGPEQLLDVLAEASRLLRALYACPIPVVAGCAGHAIGSGAVLLLACDYRIGAEGPFKLGLNELAIGLPVPSPALEIARDRLDRRHLVEATLGARLYDPAVAAEVGFLDEVVTGDDVHTRALATAAGLAAFPREAFASTKRCLRAQALDRMHERDGDAWRRPVSHRTGSTICSRAVAV